MAGRLTSKVVFITAAAQGIGRACAERFAKEGARVIASDMNGEKIKELNGIAGIETHTLNVTNRAEIEKLAATLPKVDVLLNIAGMVYAGSILESTEQQWDKIFDVNVKSMFHTCQVFLPKMLAAKNGVIINMASVASSHSGVPNRCIYSSTKGAVIGLTKSMAADFVKDGIRVNCICPGTIDTPSLNERFAATGDAAAVKKQYIETRQKSGRLGKPEEIAALAVYLATDEAEFVTGQKYIIDGGWTM
ncbi:dehydrogenase/reductase SDR family member 6-like isoform X1 [Rhopilema esculentum]|uniref:dehydrogenase/reductase SDR family member 6-like isoform X1 n=1 Tax=Rhopilema esculentum TaxID=499914 RepID=UPI0031DC0A1F|eukprot:gene7675-13498_t